MKAILLVAGLGTRLRPLTDTIPKCLLPLGGKPLLQIWLERFEDSDVHQVLVNTHWLSEKVELFLKQYRKNSRLEITTFHEPELLGSAGTLAANKSWLEGDVFYIIYGDNLAWLDLTEMKQFHYRHRLPVTLGVFRAPHPERCGIAEVGADGIVSAFVEKPENPKSNLAAAGIYIADSRIFDDFPEPSKNKESVLDLGFHVFPNLAGKMKRYEIEELIDIGTPEAYELAKQVWQTRER